MIGFKTCSKSVLMQGSEKWRLWKLSNRNKQWFACLVKQINHKRRALFSYRARYHVIEFSISKTTAKLSSFSTISSLYVHYMFTICSLYNILKIYLPYIHHYIFTICWLYIHYMFTKCLLYFHHMFTICSLYVHYIFTTCSLHVDYMLTICSLYINYMFTLY